MHNNKKAIDSGVLTPAQKESLPELFEKFLNRFEQPVYAIRHCKDCMANFWLQQSYSELELALPNQVVKMDSTLLMLKNFYKLLKSLEEVAIDEHYEKLDNCQILAD